MQQSCSLVCSFAPITDARKRQTGMHGCANQRRSECANHGWRNRAFPIYKGLLQRNTNHRRFDRTSSQSRRRAHRARGRGGGGGTGISKLHPARRAAAARADRRSMSGARPDDSRRTRGPGAEPGAQGGDWQPTGLRTDPDTAGSRRCVHPRSGNADCRGEKPAERGGPAATARARRTPPTEGCGQRSAGTRGGRSHASSSAWRAFARCWRPLDRDRDCGHEWVSAPSACLPGRQIRCLPGRRVARAVSPRADERARQTKVPSHRERSLP